MRHEIQPHKSGYQCTCEMIFERKEVADDHVARLNRLSSDSFWMIEKSIDGVPHWWMRKPGQHGDWDSPERWTTDATKARHFDSKYDALHVIGDANAPIEYKYENMIGCIATEHVFMDS